MFYIICVRNFYGPKELFDFVNDSQGCPREYNTVHDAREEIVHYEGSRYVLAHNESCRPDYYIIDDDVKAWLDNDDGGKFDWPDDPIYDCSIPDYDEQNTADKAMELSIAYIREHAIKE